VLGREADEVADVVAPELAVHAVDVRLDGLARDAVLPRRLDDAAPGGDELEDLPLPHRQPLEHVDRPVDATPLQQRRQRRRDVLVAARGRAQRQAQGVQRLRLDDVGRGARRQHVQQVAHAIVDREDHDAGLRHPPPHLPRRRHAIHARQHQVHDHDVDPRAFDLSKGVARRRGLTHDEHVRIRRERLAQPGTNDRLIIHDVHPHLSQTSKNDE
jgi:hypothetical protein